MSNLDPCCMCWVGCEKYVKSFSTDENDVQIISPFGKVNLLNVWCDESLSSSNGLEYVLVVVAMSDRNQGVWCWEGTTVIQLPLALRPEPCACMIVRT